MIEESEFQGYVLNVYLNSCYICFLEYEQLCRDMNFPLTLLVSTLVTLERP